MKVPYFDFRDFPENIAAKVENAAISAIRSKQYILGPEVEAFQNEFAAYLQAGFAVGAGNGYDALVMALAALRIGKGDEVIVPANSFVATANAVIAVGARPVFADVDEQTCNLTAPLAEKKLSEKTRAVIPVHLYGQPCDLDPLLDFARSNNIFLIEDFAQSQGAAYKGKKTGSLGDVNATSFYPVKNLGALGDAGCVVTNNEEVAHFLRRYGNYGQSNKYYYSETGINSRLDSLQASVLRVKLNVLDKLNNERKRLAAIYQQELSGITALTLPFAAPACDHVYHVFSIATHKRDDLQHFLQGNGVSTLIHYPVPIHLQKPYKDLGAAAGSLPVTEKLAKISLSLPLFPGLTEPEQLQVIELVKKFFA